MLGQVVKVVVARFPRAMFEFQSKRSHHTVEVDGTVYLMVTLAASVLRSITTLNVTEI